MKLFQQLLVAGATVGLIAPIAAQASDVVNIEEMNSYARSQTKSSRIDSKTFINEVSEDIAKLKGRVDGLEAQQNNFEAGAFSGTTSMDGKAAFWIGGVDGGDEIGDTESIETGYIYSMNLNTSFTGDDNLYVRLKAGDVGGAPTAGTSDDYSIWDNKSTYHIETKDTDDSLNVDKIWYTTSIGENITAFVGPRIENYYMYITPSIYKPGALKSMKLGGNANFGASTDVGAGFKYETDGGFGFASNVVSKDADKAAGMLGKSDTNKWDTQLAYTTDRWHGSVTYSNQQNWSSHAYNATKQAAAMKSGDFTGYAFRGYWMPEDTGTATPEISFGYDIRSADDTVTSGTGKESDSYFVGLTWKDMFQADDRIGLAFTQPLKVTECNGTCTTAEVDPFVWEAYYSFRPNDSIEVRPAVFGGSDVYEDGDDIFGTVLTTVFKF